VPLFQNYNALWKDDAGASDDNDKGNAIKIS